MLTLVTGLLSIIEQGLHNDVDNTIQTEQQVLLKQYSVLVPSMSKRKTALQSQIGQSRTNELIPDIYTPGSLNDSDMHRPFGPWSSFEPFGLVQTSELNADLNEINSSIFGNGLDTSANMSLSQSISLA